MILAASILLLALTRAEIIERMKAPVVTQCEGLVQVFANCPEDMRREYQMPVASFASETVKTLYQGLSIKPKRRERAAIKIYVGDVRTNDAAVVVRLATNDAQTVTRIYVPSPGYADLRRLKLEVIKAFLRSVVGEERTDDEAIDAYRKADPRFRLEDDRARLGQWLAGTLPSPTPEDDEANLALMRKVMEPGVSTRTDVMLFASRLHLYPATFDRPFGGRFDSLTFREAVKLRKDPEVRRAAFAKSGMLIAMGGGRSDELAEASRHYFAFLLELAKGEKDDNALLDLLETADVKLNLALENAGKRN